MVTHLKEQKLSFVDLNTFELVYSEAFPFEIHSLEMLARNQVALAGQLEEEVLVLDLNSGRTETLLELGQGITSMNYDQREQLLFITDAKHHRLHVYHLGKDEVVQSIQVENHPLQVSLDDGGNYIYVLSGGNPSITVINRLNYAVELTFPVLDMPTDLIFDGQYAWVTGHGHYTNWNESIKAYDPLSGENVREVKVGLMPIYFYDDSMGEEFFVLCHGSNEMYAIDRNTYEVTETVLVDDNPHYMSGNDQYLFVTSLDGNKLTVIDRNTYEVIAKTDMAAGPFGIAIGELEDE
ncbi:hypothetical protein BTR23_06195 [Alkalihalophilus pseudofirmus]|nr:hypothetical protein BTR23_06195 [Alkalihalophilus pseudofirmus]